MKLRLLFIFQVLILVMTSSCDDDDTDYGDWKKKSPLDGVSRTEAIYFTIGDYSYVGLGVDKDGDYLTDMYRYDATVNSWTQMASFPGTPRVSAVAFAANEKGYVCTGFNDDLDEEELGDLWEYDPDSDTWTEKAEFIGSARYNAVAFSYDNKGYVGTGYDGNWLKDFYEYNPETDSWTTITSFFGEKRESATAFTIDGTVYIASGRNNGSYLYDFWKYTPDSELGAWTSLTLEDDDDTYDEFIEAVARYDATSFSIDGLGYIGLGISSSYSTDFYVYDPESNEWDDDVTDFEGSGRSNAASFVISNVPYVTTGGNSSSTFDDIWAYYPDEEYDESSY